METDSHILIDHKNRDGLDNTSNNLRRATKSQNAFNSKNRTGTSSIFRGVTYDKYTGRWKAYIRIDGVHTTLGRFNSQRDAALAYDNAACIHHKEFATLNFK